MEDFTSQSRQDEQGKFEELKSITRKEARKEFKKFREALDELKR